MNTLNITETVVHFTAQGFEGSLDLATFDQAGVDYILAYGARRAVQDRINSLAAAKRNDGEEVTDKWIKETVESVLAALSAGDVRIRGASASGDPMDDYRIRVLRKAMKDPKNAELKAGYDAVEPATDKARREYLLAVAASDKHQAAIDKAAAAMKARDEKEREALSGLDIAM